MRTGWAAASEEWTGRARVIPEGWTVFRGSEELYTRLRSFSKLLSNPVG